VRQKLAVGSKERLLLSFYGGCILPLRNCMHACAIQLLTCDDEVVKKALLHQVTANATLLPIGTDKRAAGVLMLREFRMQDQNHPVFYTRPLGLWGGRKHSCQL